MKSRFAPVRRERFAASLAAAAVTVLCVAASGASAEEKRSGFYLRADLGANLATERIQQAKQPEIWKSLPNAINRLSFLWRSSQHST